MKYLKNLSVILLLLSFFFTKAQTVTFEKELPKHAFNPYIFENKDGQFVMSRRVKQDSVTFNDEVSILDNKGNIIKSISILPKDSINFVIDRVLEVDTGYLLIGRRFDSSNRRFYNFWIASLDKNLSMTMQKHSSKKYENLFLLDATLHHNDVYFAVSQIFDFPELILGKFDFNHKEFIVNDTIGKKNNFKGHGGSIMSFDDRLITGEGHQISDSLTLIRKAPYTFLDPPRPPLVTDGLIRYGSSDFLMFGHNGQVPIQLVVMKVKYPYYKKQNYIFGKKDTNDTPALFKGISFYHKNNIFVGGTSGTFFSFDTPNWFIVSNLDSLLKPRWVKYFGGDAIYMMHGVVATKDNGCLLYGTKEYNDNINRTYLMKINDKGELVSTDNVPLIEQRIKVFPNPAKDIINVSSSVLDNELTVCLYDMLGRLLISKTFTNFTTLDVVNFNTGIYNYVITDSNNKVIQTNKIILK